MPRSVLNSEPTGSDTNTSDTNTSDAEAVVAIGNATATRSMTSTSHGGVAIGQNVYGTEDSLNLCGGVLVGHDLFTSVTSAGDKVAQDTVAIGRDICASTTTGQVRDSVLIGSKSCTLLEAGKVVAVGSQSLRGATVSSEAVAIGYAAGQNSIVGSGTVLLGRSCGRNLSGDSSYTVGNNSVFIGTGPINDSMAAIPGGSDCVMIGRDACPTHATDNGQIRIGNASNHTSMLLEVDASIRLQTNSLVNIQTTQTSTTIRASDSAPPNKVTLECGSKTTTLNSQGLTVNCPLILSNGVMCSADGKSYMPGSFWASGSAIVGDEKRHIILNHLHFGIDSSHSSVVMASYGYGVTTPDTIDPLNSLSSTKDDYAFFNE